MPEMGKISVAALLTLVLLAGCGGDGGGSEGGVPFERGDRPAPSRCVERWNSSEEALRNGRHAYGTTHQSRAAHVFLVTDREAGLQNDCAVIFAAREEDREFGTLGWVEFPNGWDLMTLLPADSPDEIAELQREAARQANVSVDEGGRLAPLL